MAVTVKSEKQIALMREAGRLLAITHEELHKALKPGMTTLDIDRLGEEIIRDFGLYRISRIIMDSLLLSVYPSMMKLFTESLLIRES